MATDAHGRLLSEDGNYYWDGDAWQLAGQSAAAGSQQPQTQAQNVDAQGRLLSEDGIYYWDGANWQLVDRSAAARSQNSTPQARFAQGFADAMARAGYEVDANMVPAQAQLQAGLAAAQQFYQELDPISRAVIDEFTADPGSAAIGLSQTGIVSGIDSLLHAFDQIPASLGDLLQAAGESLGSNASAG
ncbi:MAG TPA: hypothetical protein VGM10_00655 [Actinocrinis sp.]|jgi:hypothetical protein